MIQVKKLTKYYKDFAALKEFSFSAERGQVVALLGLNGAGKTTCLRILSGYLRPSSGHCLIDGLDVFTHPMQVKFKLGYLPEDSPLYRELTVGDYLRFVARMRGLPNRDFIQEWKRVSKLAHLGLLYNALIRELSLGYRKRVGIAQALIASPPVIILDEPISGLDPVQIVEMRKLIRNLTDKHTILISSHILTEVSRTCDKVVIIHKGEFAGELQGEEVQRDLEAKFIELTR